MASADPTFPDFPPWRRRPQVVVTDGRSRSIRRTDGSTQARMGLTRIEEQVELVGVLTNDLYVDRLTGHSVRWTTVASEPRRAIAAES